MKRTRLDRRNDFNAFYESAKSIFTEFREKDKRAEKFQDIYMLNICPGSRHGGNNSRVVEVFWGSRQFETITQGRDWTALKEYGATLLFECDDSGFVIISLYPANTDNKKPIESSITTGIWLDPRKLKENYFLKKNWNDLMAYMEYTSLDGNPTVFQKIRISYLRTFKHLIIENKWRPTKFSGFLKETAKFTLTVGLSGFIIYFVTLFSARQSENKKEQQLNLTQKKVNELTMKLDSVVRSNTDLSTLSSNIDSIKYNVKEILKKVDNQKKD